jgi:hypothetical protein
MKAALGFILFIAAMLWLGVWYESTLDPYEEGMHFDYSIKCENGFVYKSMSGNRGTIQVLNSDGTPLKCGHKIY